MGEIRLGGAKPFVPRVAPKTNVRVRRDGEHFVIEGSYGPDFMIALDMWPGARPELRDGKYYAHGAQALSLLEALEMRKMAEDSKVVYDESFEEERKALMAKRRHRAEMSRALDPQDAAIGLSSLRPYQRAALEFILEVLSDRKGALLADEMGLGKSLAALAAVEQLDAYPCIILAPALATHNWKAEILGGYGKTGWLRHRTVFAPSSPKIKPKDADFTIMSYDSAWRCEWLLSKDWAFAILDESHYIRNPGAMRTMGARLVTGKVKEKRIVLLSGTPIVNKFDEILPQLDVVGRKEELGGEQRFRSMNIKKAEDAHDELRMSLMARRLKIDALPQLPPKHRDTQPVEVDLTEYNAAEEEMMAWLSTVDGDDLDFEDKGRANGHFMKLRKLAGKAKVQWCIDWANNFLLSGDYLVIFTHHVEDVADPIAKALEGWGMARIKGGSSPKSRMEAIDTLRQGKNKVLVASTQASGVSLDMTMAATALMAELQWTPATLEQAEDRLARSGQTRPVEIIYPLAEGTVDARVWDIMWNKHLETTALMNGVSTEFSVRKALVEEMRGKRKK